MRNVVMCNQQIKDECNKCGFLGDSWLFPRRITDNTASYFDQRVDVTFLKHSLSSGRFKICGVRASHSKRNVHYSDCSAN